MRAPIIMACLLSAVLFTSGAPQASERTFKVAAAPQADGPPAKDDDEKEQSPEEKMRARFPQPVRVGFLIGLPVLDWEDSTIGYVSDVVRTPGGKIKLIVPYGRVGWVRYGGLFDRRPIAVPLEVVAILARQIAALDMSREEFDTAPTWDAAQTTPISRDDTIRIAVTRR